MIKRLLKWLGLTLAAGLVALIAVAINVIWYKPFSIKVFYERVFLEFALDSPEMLSSMRLLEQVGLNFHNDDLDDVSPAHTRKLNDKVRRDLAMLRSYDQSELEGQTALSYDILEWFLEQQARGAEFTWHGYPVNQMFGVQNDLPDFMVQIHHIGSQKDARNYVTRLSKFGTKFDQLLEDLRLREEQGIIPPRFVVDKVLEEMNGFRNRAAGDNILYTSFVERLQGVEGIEEAMRESLNQAVLDQLEATVYPAYDELIEYFEELRPRATTNHGVWNLPNGAAYYNHVLRGHTTTDMSAEEIHQLGLDEVARIQGEMDAILTAEGYVEGSVAERVAGLNEEQRFLYPDTEEGRAQLLADYQQIIDEIDARMDEMFDLRPTSSVEVRRVPEFREQGAAGAYYQGPSMDGSRPGVFYVNLRNIKEQARYQMRTLAYHEAIPGHHFQTALQTELTGVPQFRRVLPFTAFAEGWGLYSERLAWEAGFVEDPYSNLGRLRDELLRAVRLVVDTGIHKKRWSREEAIAYMMSNTGLTETEVVAEVERYFVLPGQATAYKVGMMKILELRERAKTELGDEFDIREFHNVVLRNGDLPLAILEEQVDAYINEKIAM